MPRFQPSQGNGIAYAATARLSVSSPKPMPAISTTCRIGGLTERATAAFGPVQILLNKAWGGRADAGTWSKIPDSNEQGIFSKKQGYLKQDREFGPVHSSRLLIFAAPENAGAIHSLERRCPIQSAIERQSSSALFCLLALSAQCSSSEMRNETRPRKSHEICREATVRLLDNRHRPLNRARVFGCGSHLFISLHKRRDAALSYFFFVLGCAIIIGG